MRAIFGSMAWAVLCAAGISACASAAPSAQNPASPNAAAARPTPASEPAQAAAAPQKTEGTQPSESQPASADESSKSAESAPAEQGDGLRKASRPPAELITGPNVVYVFNFKNSAVGASAAQKCSAEAPDDPAAERACLSKARSEVPVEFVRFIKDKGEFWWVTYNRYKGNLLKWHKVQFTPGKETDSTITLNLVGKDKGIAPMARVPHSLNIELPNDYSIVVNDPELGQMSYDAKIGLMEAE